MSKIVQDEFYVKPNHKKDGTKHHKAGFSEAEDIQNKRAQKLHFKSYIQQQKELEDLADLDGDLDEEILADIKRLMR